MIHCRLRQARKRRCTGGSSRQQQRK